MPTLMMKPAMPVSLSPTLSSKRARVAMYRYGSFTLRHWNGLGLFAAPLGQTYGQHAILAASFRFSIFSNVRVCHHSSIELSLLPGRFGA
ncbi:hypothetical protein GALLN_00051 [Gallionellaceae bacterium]|nr:hypothetical protein GALLN_00051 [Gallionellaceae bacterium]